MLLYKKYSVYHIVFMLVSAEFYHFYPKFCHSTPSGFLNTYFLRLFIVVLKELHFYLQCLLLLFIEKYVY